MASATFTLRAVDATRQAFASVQNSLQRLQSTTKKIGVGLASFFGLSAAVGGIKRLDAFLEDAERNAKKLGLSAKDLDELTVATDAADRAAMFLQKNTALAAANVAKVFSGIDVGAKAAEIRLERSAEKLKELNEQIESQKTENSLLSRNEGARLSVLEVQLDVLTSELDCLYDAEEIARQQLDIEKKRHELISATQKFELDTSAALQDQKRIRKELNAAIGIERDVIQESNELLEYRQHLSTAIRNVDTSTSEGIANQNAARRERNQVDQELIPLLEKRFALERQIGETVADNFQNAVFEGGKFMELLKQMLLQLTKMVFYETITKRMASSISGFLTGNPLASVFAGTPAAKGTALEGFAEGGSVSGNKPIVVGERGPELFVPKSAGTIVPNGGSGGGASGSSVNITYNIQSGVSRAELAPILETERKRLKAEIPDMVRRGGSYRAAFA